MGSTRIAFFVAFAASLAACNSQTPFAPAGAPVALAGAGQRASTANQSGTKIMTVQIARSFSDTKHVKIFDNLARFPSGTYFGSVDAVIVGGGGNSTFPEDQIAAAFTPSADHTATVVEVAVNDPHLGYGTSGFSLSLNDDDKGVPGKALLSAQLPDLPTNGLGFCCELVIGNIPSGLALHGGKQYWIVLNGQNALSSDAAGWSTNTVDQVHPFLDAAYCAYASKCGNGVGWHTFQGIIYYSGAAFAVLGSN